MKKKKKFARALLLSVVMAGAASFANARPAAADGVTFTVTAVGKKDTVPRVITKDDVQLHVGKERTQIADWKRGETLYLAVLIDDSLESSIANQWNDLREFLMAQPATTYVAVAYARNGTAMLAQDFTKDHALAAKALRIPIGNAGAFSSPYFALPVDLAAVSTRLVPLFPSRLNWAGSLSATSLGGVTFAAFSASWP